MALMNYAIARESLSYHHDHHHDDMMSTQCMMSCVTIESLNFYFKIREKTEDAAEFVFHAIIFMIKKNLISIEMRGL